MFWAAKIKSAIKRGLKRGLNRPVLICFQKKKKMKPIQNYPSHALAADNLSNVPKFIRSTYEIINVS